ncbi:hypothetical protein [Scytonema sp. PRP1]|uniref:hypothetical protein n=1 Tax=Scytonema sp. PRP1 TaxID=3120513 RepID=UPI002FCE84E7
MLKNSGLHIYQKFGQHKSLQNPTKSLTPMYRKYLDYPGYFGIFSVEVLSDPWKRFPDT